MGRGIGLLLLLAGMGLFFGDAEAMEGRRRSGPAVALMLVGTGLFLRRKAANTRG